MTANTVRRARCTVWFNAARTLSLSQGRSEYVEHFSTEYVQAHGSGRQHAVEGWWQDRSPPGASTGGRVGGEDFGTKGDACSSPGRCRPLYGTAEGQRAAC